MPQSMRSSNTMSHGRGIFAASLLLVFACGLPAQRTYDEPWRPQFHFTPPKNFMNDPNGLVYYKGEYHLFYQYNPQGTEWGHMSWGHAVSADMLHWKNLPVAIPEEAGQYMIYSGSAVVDWHNASGLCASPDAQDPSCLIAIYTAAGTNVQSQHLAFSNDRGRTWTNYPGNPIADLKQPDFRDPKVFWYEAEKKWVMVAVLADERKAVFFDSRDLKNWTFRSSFEIEGNDKGQWECPDLFELTVDGKTKNKKWVLIVNRNPGAPAGGTGTRYFVGSFDGTHFVNEPPAAQELWADYGRISTQRTRFLIFRRRTTAEYGSAGSAIGNTRTANQRRFGEGHSRCRASLPWRNSRTESGCCKNRSPKHERCANENSCSSQTFPFRWPCKRCTWQMYAGTQSKSKRN